MKEFLRGILDLVYPPVCHLCDGELAPHERFVCTPCRESLPRTGYHRNFRNPMEKRFAGRFPFVTATGHFFYSKGSSLSELIQDMKYRGFPSIGDMLGEMAGKELLISGFLSDVEMVVPLPMHWLKRAKRGYNQTDRIAKGIEKATGIEVRNALRMKRRRKTQTALSASQRLVNAEDLFEARKGFDLNGKGVLLVDDICTTGTTMASAAKTLTDAFPDIRLYLFALGLTF